MSTSLDHSVGFDFMRRAYLGKDMSRVLYEITWDWDFDYYIIDEDLSVYSTEREVLLNDGTTYEIDKISER